MKRSRPRRRLPPDRAEVRIFRETVIGRARGKCEIGPTLARGCADYQDDVDMAAALSAAYRACRGVGTEAHHRLPRGMGGHGTNDPANGVCACTACHRWVESHRRYGYLLGLLERHR